MNNIEACKLLGIPYSSANLYYQTYNPSLERTCVYEVDHTKYRFGLRLISDTNPPPVFRTVIEKVGFENMFITDYQYSYNKPFLFILLGITCLAPITVGLQFAERLS